MAQLVKCKLCQRQKQKDGNIYCEKCEISLFQIRSILREYMSNSNPPLWMTEGLGELFSWIFNGNPSGSGFFNTANEIMEIFAIDRADKIPRDDLSEINWTNLPEERILKILEDAFIITYDPKFLYPGPLSQKLIDVRWEGYEMNTPEIKQKLKEIHGIIAVAITYGLLNGENNRKPKYALAIFYLLSHIMTVNGIDGDIEPIISEYDLDIALNKLAPRQRAKIRRTMLGLIDGDTKIITDKDIEGRMQLNPITIAYIQNMRERYRERERSERSYS